ncbi:hypothetical protein ONZ45_g5037 [Pleurotus djamor]|nr:hypothetical protein ONZ45_g5037 [Pleurotus djamor]
MNHHNDPPPILPTPIPTQSEADSRPPILREQLRAVSKAHNAEYGATSKLPAEVLVQIFDLVRLSHLSCDNHPAEKLKPFYTWAVEVTHVCSAWRTIALNTPTLWNFALLMPVGCATEIMKRVKTAPFDMAIPVLPIEDVNDAANPHVSAMKAAFAKPDQMRGLHFSVSSETPILVFKFLEDLIGSSKMPRLAIMTIGSVPACYIPDSFLGGPGCAPQLQKLILMNCTANLNTPRFRRLHVVDISVGMESDVALMSANELLAAIREMPELLVLHLKHVGKEDSGQIQVSPFELGELSSLRIVDVCPALLPIFRVIKAPKISVVEVAIAPVFENHSAINNLDDVQYVYSVASLNKSRRHALTLLKEYDTASISVYHTEVDERGEVVKDLEVRGMELSVESVWDILPLGELYSLCVLLDHDDLPPRVHLLNAISSLSSSPQLANVEVPYLTFVTKDHMMDASKFPALINLQLDCIYHKPKNSSLCKLRNWLMLREARGYKRLKSLIIKRCPHSKPSIIQALTELVDWFEVQDDRAPDDEDNNA